MAGWSADGRNGMWGGLGEDRMGGEGGQAEMSEDGLDGGDERR